LGRSKLESARERLTNLNPEVRIETYEVKLTADNALDVLRGYDVVVDGSDNFPTRYLVSDACVLLGVPTVYGAIFRFDGQASVFGAPGGPCYRCLFREPPPAELVPNCVEAGVLGVLPGVVGTIQATEAVKLILGLGESLAGRLLLIDSLRMDFRTVAVQKDPACPACGDEPSITELIDYELFCGMTDAGVEGDGDVPEIGVEELKAALDAREPLAILDVREEYEWVICNLGRYGARLIPESELVGRLGEIDPKARLVVYCRSGARSAKAVEFLQQAGYTDAFNLRGGILAWGQKIDPEMAVY
jgi:adenylyltransferase/sulfurtransferase